MGLKTIQNYSKLQSVTECDKVGHVLKMILKIKKNISIMKKQQKIVFWLKIYFKLSFWIKIKIFYLEKN